MPRTVLPPAVYLAPMKALGTNEVPSGHWLCEIKFDGYRAIALLNGGEAALWSRNRKPMSGDYPGIVAALGKIKCRNAVLDGEIVALDHAGHSRFQLLQRRDHPGARPNLVYYLFDLLHLDGQSLLERPLEERRKQLVALLREPAQPVQLSPQFAVEPADLLAAARQQGLEGVIAKRPGSPYEPGRRSG